VQNKFHLHFKLNDISFSSESDLCDYAKEISLELSLFLEDWLDEKKHIIVKTSGSTGKPKSIQLSKEHMVNSAKATGSYFNLGASTTALLCLPINYIAGKMMLVRALTLGWHLDVIASSSSPLENLSKTYDFSAMVPLQVENSLSNLELIKKLIVGGGVISDSLHQKLQNVSTSVFATYGMTETITHIALKKINGVGRASTLAFKQNFYQCLPNVSIYIDDRNCLVIKAPLVSKEIIFTNDVVQLVSSNQFEWLGRFDNIINSGGIKLNPEQIENKLAKLISNRFFVAGVKDQKLGEKLVLVVEGSENSKLFEEIKNARILDKYEVPKTIYFIRNFIETATGKVQRTKTIDVLALGD
jgi:O-succinylbenzoic acid--CoA ligase